MDIIKKNKHYTNAWNSFSKQLFMQDYIDENSGPVLWVLPEEKQLSQYSKVAYFLNSELQPLSSFSQIIELCYNNIWNYFTHQSIFQISFPKSEYDINNSILTLSLWEEISIDSITKKFHDLWYKYSKNFNAWSFMI